MKFSVAKEHKHFYTQKGYIEFESLLTQSQLQQLKGVINGLPLKLSNHRDIWRSNLTVRRVATQDRLIEVAAELTDFQTLRLGYDHIWNNKTLEIYPAETSLVESGSLQGVACGLIICLEAGENIAETDSFNLPSKPGSGMYVSPTMRLDFSKGIEKGGHYILFAYAFSNAVFLKNPLDAYGISFRDMGYAYGDRLIDSRNPIVYRR